MLYNVYAAHRSEDSSDRGNIPTSARFKALSLSILCYGLVMWDLESQEEPRSPPPQQEPMSSQQSPVSPPRLEKTGSALSVVEPISLIHSRTYSRIWPRLQRNNSSMSSPISPSGLSYKRNHSKYIVYFPISWRTYGGYRYQIRLLHHLRSQRGSKAHNKTNFIKNQFNVWLPEGFYPSASRSLI